MLLPYLKVYRFYPVHCLQCTQDQIQQGFTLEINISFKMLNSILSCVPVLCAEIPLLSIPLNSQSAWSVDYWPNYINRMGKMFFSLRESCRRRTPCLLHVFRVGKYYTEIF